jgi:hypothetical protein
MEYPTPQDDPVSKETVARVKRAAQNLLDTIGAESKDGTTQQALIGVDYSALTEHPESVLPTVSVTKALGELATNARWDFGITIGAQDAQVSRHALFMKDDAAQPEIAYYDGRPDRAMTELEAIAIAADLERAIESPSSNEA